MCHLIIRVTFSFECIICRNVIVMIIIIGICKFVFCIQYPDAKMAPSSFLMRDLFSLYPSIGSFEVQRIPCNKRGPELSQGLLNGSYAATLTSLTLINRRRTVVTCCLASLRASLTSDLPSISFRNRDRSRCV